MEKRHAEGKSGRARLPRPETRGREQGEGGADRSGANGLGVGDRQAAEVALPEAAGKAPREPAYLTVTEDSIKAALIEARGDMFVASQLLNVTSVRLYRAIQVSPVLQATLRTLQESPKGLSLEALHAAIEERTTLYRVAGLDALHDLATMPIDENSAQNQVKLAAAARLAGSAEGTVGSGALEETLRELNQAYQANAPRLKVTRERLTVETLPPERVVASQEKND